MNNSIIHLKDDIIDEDCAIYLSNVTRGYGNSKVIENLNLSIKKGSINALVGASGSGKTTLLRIILGRLIPDSGDVLVFGMKPHSNRKTVPGSLVGYAPQENALYSDITIEETLRFFATLHNMSEVDYQERKSYMIKLLDLPELSRIVGNLSGGQKRRVSLAIALLHSPKLLILDEPTVGLDPLLRNLVISHLKEIASIGGVTVIITTHYIEEARVADQVFLMRYGKILENGQPEQLIKKYDCENLEDVFLQICRADESKTNQLINSKLNFEFLSPNINNIDSNNNNNNNSIQVETTDNQLSSILLDSSSTNIIDEKVTFEDDDDDDNNNNNNNNEKESLLNRKKKNINSNNKQKDNNNNNNNDDYETPYLLRKTKHTLAIGKRKLTQILRNKIVLFFELFSPTFQIVLYFICIGGTPKNLNFGVVNNDIGIGSPLNLYLGLDLINELDSSGIFNFHYYNQTTDAISRVKSGELWGVLEIPQNFTTALPERFQNPGDSSIESQSNLELYMDFTNYQITELVQQELQLAFEALGQQFNISINPVVIEPAIYGSTSANFLWFLAPGMIALITFAHAIGITAVSFVREKVDGSLDRLFAYNVSPSTIILGHFLGHVLLLVVQTGILLLISIVAFKIPNRGDIFLVFIIVVLNGFVGMSLGLIISSVSKIEVEAIQLSLACYFPTLILSGTLWPIQGISYDWAKWIPNVLPATHAASALRDLMIKGVSFSFPEVYQGFLIVLAWFIGLFFISTFALKEKEKNSTLLLKLFKKNK